MSYNLYDIYFLISNVDVQCRQFGEETGEGEDGKPSSEGEERKPHGGGGISYRQ